MLRKTVSWSTVAVLIFSWFAIPASAQHFKQVKGSLVAVTAGRNEVFGIDASLNVWRINAAKTAFDKIAGASSFIFLSAGGGSGSTLDDVWGLDVNANVYRFNYKTKTFDQITGVLTWIAVGEGLQDSCHPYEVWGLNNQFIYRYNYCTNAWDQPGGQLAAIATGGGDVWGIDSSGNPYYFSFASGSFNTIGGLPLTQISVGVDEVWGINHTQGPFQAARLVSTGFGFTDLFALNFIQASGDGVWGFQYPSNEVYRYDLVLDQFVEVAALPVSEIVAMTVGSGAGVYVVGSNNQVFSFVRP
jgi:hypothetical protein